MTNARTAANILTVGLLLGGLTACTGDSDEDPSESVTPLPSPPVPPNPSTVGISPTS